MYKLGTGMFIASIFLLIGWVLYKFWQVEATDEIVTLLVVVLFVGGITLAAMSEKS